MGKEVIAALGSVSKQELNRFDIKQEVLFADIHWKSVFEKSMGRPVNVEALPNQLPVYRDLAMVVPVSLAYRDVETAIGKFDWKN